MKKILMTMTNSRACSRSTKRTSSICARLIAALTAVLCCVMIMSLTSCSQNDNPIETNSIKMADAVTLNTAPQSFYELDTKDLLPIYVAVKSTYKDENGDTQFYDLSKVKKVNVSVTNDMFIVDASHLADNGYIKLTPDPDNSDTKSMVEIVEDYGVYKISGGFTVELINKYGEKLVSKLDYTYLARNEQKEVLDIKLSDLNEKKQLILEPTVLKQYDFSKWPIDRIEDVVKCETEDFIDTEITNDGKLILTTDGTTTAPDDPDKLTLIFTRNLTGSPIKQLPEGDGLMLNFRYELELNISE